MDAKHIKTWLEIRWIKGRSLLRQVVTLAGAGLFLLGTFNLFSVVVGLDPLAIYPRTQYILASDHAVIVFQDVVAMAVGLVLAWFV